MAWTHFRPETQSFSRQEKGPLRHRVGMDRVAEIHHSDRDTARGNSAARGLIVAFVAGTELHTPAMDVVDAWQGLFVIRPDVLDFDGVPVG